MKKLTIIFGLALAIIIAGCSKTEDDLSQGSQTTQEITKSAPFREISGITTGTVAEGGTSSCDLPWFPKYFEGEGNILHLGKSTARLDYCLMYTNPGPGPDPDGNVEGTAIIIAANGDEIHVDFTGTFTLTGWQFPSGGNPYPTSNLIDASGTITGGTGRFEGANGYLNGSGDMDLTVIPNIIVLEWSGEIMY